MVRIRKRLLWGCGFAKISLVRMLQARFRLGACYRLPRFYLSEPFFVSGIRRMCKKFEKEREFYETNRTSSTERDL